VAIGDVDVATAEATAAELGGGTIALPLDVTDHRGFTSFLDAVESHTGRPIDILVNNAGIMALGPLDEESEAVTIRQLEINLHAVIHGTREAMRRMGPRGTGHIVNIASSAGKTGVASGATYCATKFGVVGLSEAVRAELRGSGVEVSVVMPGLVDTELAGGLQDTRGIKRSTPQAVADAIVAALKVPRFDVYVPRSIGPMAAFVGVLPRGARDAVSRALKVDRVLARADHGARAGYESRASRSAPAAEAVVAEVAGETERSAA
jgi:short-subunit dehydrogenase